MDPAITLPTLHHLTLVVIVVITLITERTEVPFSEEFGTVMAQGEVVRPLCVPPFAWSCGSTALAANTLGADLEKKGNSTGISYF